MYDVAPGSDTGTSATPASGNSDAKYYPYTKIDTSSDGKPCTTVGWREGQIGEHDGMALVAEAQKTLYGAYPSCPQRPNSPAEVLPRLTPVVVAMKYWEEIPLPEPRPYIAPGWAITGKRAYLETRGETRHVYTNNTVLGPLEIVATGQYYVDWGDGESSGPHSVEGRAWPDGEITHDYVWAGTYDIVVTERWTATWRLGGESGVLRQLRTTGRIDDFPARQIQAVVGSVKAGPP